LSRDVAVLDAGFAAVENVEEFAFTEGDGDVDDQAALFLEAIFL
jgi:hypothetical protein